MLPETEEDEVEGDAKSSGSENVPFMISPSGSSKGRSDDGQDTQSDTESDVPEKSRRIVATGAIRKEERQENIEACLKLTRQANTFLLYINKDHETVRKEIATCNAMAKQLGCQGQATLKRKRDGAKADTGRTKACDIDMASLRTISDRLWNQR